MSLIKTNPWGLVIGKESEQTIASGVITVVSALQSVDTQSDAASDDLDTINGGFDGAGVLLRPANVDRAIVLKHNTGNLLLPNAADVTLNASKLYQALWYDASLGKWLGWESAYYILRDLFVTARAAGAVNGTAAEPGPGTRTVVDTESKLTITGGQLSISAGKAVPAYGDPGIAWPAITRAAGKVLLGTVNSPSGAAQFRIGFSATVIGACDRQAFRFTATIAAVVFNSATTVAVGSIAATTAYQWAIVPRSAGAFYFIKGGTYTNWTLLYCEAVNSSAALSPAVSNYDAVVVGDNIGIPARLWLPSALASDSFNRGDGALNGSETDGAGHAEADSGSGVAWTAEASWAISTNRAVNTPTLGGELAAGNLTVGSYYKITATEVDHFFTSCAIGDTFRATATTALDANNKVQLITAADLLARLASVSVADVNAILLSNTADGMQQGLLLRYIDANNYIIAYVDRALTTVKVDEKAAGTWANIVSGALTYADAKRTYVRITGNKVRLYFNEALIGSEGTVTNTSGTVHGLFSTDSGNSADSLEIWPVGSGGEYAALDTM